MIVAKQDVTIEARRLVRGYGRTSTACAPRSPPRRRKFADTCSKGHRRIKSTLSVLLPVVVGALLTWFTSAWRDETCCSRLQADALALRGLHVPRTGQTYLREWTARTGGATPSGSSGAEQPGELVAQLRKVSVLRPRWILPTGYRTCCAVGHWVNG